MHTSQSSGRSLDLLSLPYDIRYTIFTHLFPPDEQIYLEASPKGATATLACILPECHIPTSLLRTCQQLNAEASAFLYNNYLFNIVGTKRECLAAYDGFRATLARYARSGVRTNAFSNGAHAATGCISLQAGTAKMGVLARRRRGEARTLEELREEVGSAEGGERWGMGGRRWATALMGLCALLVGVVAYIMSNRDGHEVGRGRDQ